MKKSILKYCDSLGPEKIIHIYDPPTGLKAIVVVDNTRLGQAIGGIRMAPDVTEEEVFRLARAMTLKNSISGLDHGGGKSIIQADPRQLSKEEYNRLIVAFANAIENITEYIPGPDMGTNEQVMKLIHSVTGRVVGLPAEAGGIPLDEIGATGLGVCASAETACRIYDIDLKGARIAVQGFGAVGSHAARYLREKGAVLVAATDIIGTVEDQNGLDIDELVALKNKRMSVINSNQGKKGIPEAIISVDCDIWIPAARPDIITMKNVDQLNTRLIVQGANIPITVEAEEHLHKKGVYVMPDFVANAGGVICGAVEYHGGNELEARQVIYDKVSENTERMIMRSMAHGITPREAAMMLAMERLQGVGAGQVESVAVDHQIG